MKLLLALIFAAAPASAIDVEKVRVTRPLAQGGGGQTEIEVVSGQAMARFDASLSRSAREAALSLHGMALVQELPPTGWTLISLSPASSVEGGLISLRAVSGVLEAEPNHAYRLSRIPNDPSYPNQYHLGTINAPAAWEYETGGSSLVTVAVMDAGIEGTHPDLVGKFVGNSQFCNPGPTKTVGGGDETACATEAPAVAACNHGTRVSGVAAASSNNGTGVTGVSWDAKLLSIRVFRTQDCTSDCSGAGCATDDPTIINAINYAKSINNQPAIGRIVLNISLGEEGTACPSAIQNAISAAVAGSTGVVIVAAAGNAGSSISAPGNCSGVIPVGATDVNNNVASFSNTGAELSANGVVAPGVSIVTTDLNGGITGGATGTSFSAPLVSGVAALIIAAKPTLSPTQVRDTIRGSAGSTGVASVSDAARLMGNTTGAGLVNAKRAVKLAIEGTLSGSVELEKIYPYPNPFRLTDTSAITLNIPPSIPLRGLSVKIYTADGQLVRDLKASTSWDGKNDHGRLVATGVYLVLVKSESGSQTGRVAVIR